MFFKLKDEAGEVKFFLKVDNATTRLYTIHCKNADVKYT